MVVLPGLMLAIVLAMLDNLIVGTALPRIVGELGGLEHFSWVVTALLAFAYQAYTRLGWPAAWRSLMWMAAGLAACALWAAAIRGLKKSGALRDPTA